MPKVTMALSLASIALKGFITSNMKNIESEKNLASNNRCIPTYIL
jgi:hypothetical protein